MARHEAIEAALRAGDPNPLPEELSPDEWEEQLAAYHDGGPGDCPLLQNAETAAEIPVEMLPDHWAELDAATQAARLRIYWESLPDLAEEQFHTALLAVTEAGHADVAGLIGEELKRREQEAPYPVSCAA